VTAVSRPVEGTKPEMCSDSVPRLMFGKRLVRHVREPQVSVATSEPWLQSETMQSTGNSAGWPSSSSAAHIFGCT
jgi:hypothetical protein